jgi:hypothetical protein
MFLEVTEAFEAAFMEYILYIQNIETGVETELKKIRSTRGLLELASDPK